MKRPASTKSNTKFTYFDDGAVLFRMRLVVSILTNRPIVIRNIRHNDLEAPGLSPREINFLRLLDQMTNGSQLEINTAGTQLRFQPGLLTGGIIEHDCSNSRNEESPHHVGWLVQGILPLAPFGKEALQVTFTNCVTDGLEHQDPSIDYWKKHMPILYQQFGIGIPDPNDFLADSPPAIHIRQRGGAPRGGGQVELYCPIVTELQSIDWTDPGLIKRVRGTVVSTQLISSSTAARAAYAAKGVFHRLLPDVWIHTDAHTIKQHKCGPSPAVSILLTAESTTGVMLSAEACLGDQKQQREAPEELGQRAACALLEEIRRGGCIDTDLQATALLLMCLTPQDVSRVRVGTLSQYTIHCLRLYKELLGIEFKVQPDMDTKTVMLSCLGVGYRNNAKAST
ncbi:RNA 3'-terminal phosphate cyclase-like protein [Fistulifera solaris]|uniref:RNA 3'-terminal phosphate cyclase-like protein n=1 Tax=Fistulifera solaris TaxID=1519565 RepID=A0A1Z5JTT0_FISSO|nr:RNA 3'-terminal phosphate cyclase-like protein [Fistulifera solaris]|eukprot:GAX17417.1 RNA 3'-terminal phosphate cyclase-like protein [Fistulifera solaris]